MQIIGNNKEAETWIPAKEYEDFYEVSNIGRVRRITKSKGTAGGFLKLRNDRKGYPTVFLSVNGRVKTMRVHRLVAQVFILNVDNKPFINHINGIKTDNRVENLEWCTQAENMQHAVRTGLLSFKRKISRNAGPDNGHARRIAQFDLMGNKIKEYDCATRAQKETGICCVAIRQAARRNDGSKNRGKAGGYKWKFLAERNYIVKHKAA